MYRTHLIPLISCIALVGVRGVSAAETPLPAPYQAAAAEVGKIIGALSVGNVERGAELFAARLPKSPEPPKTPFEPSFLDTFSKAYASFPRDVDHLELVAWQPLSSSSAYLHLVVEAPSGPFMMWCLVQQRPGKGWVFHGMSFHHLGYPDPAKMKYPPTDLYPLQRFSTPLAIDLPKPE